MILNSTGLKVFTHVPLRRKHNSPHEILSSWNYNLGLTLDDYMQIFEETNIIFLPTSLNLTSYGDINSINNELDFENIFDFLMPFICHIKISHLIMEIQDLKNKQAIIEASQMAGIGNLCIFLNNNDENYDVTIVKNFTTIEESCVSFADLGLENKPAISFSPSKLYEYPRILYERLLLLNEDALMNRIYFETAISLYVYDKVNSLRTGVELVRNLIKTKKIQINMQKLVGASNALVVTS
jgi:anthranilate phosphoribosyltransferase